MSSPCVTDDDALGPLLSQTSGDDDDKSQEHADQSIPHDDDKLDKPTSDISCTTSHDKKHNDTEVKQKPKKFQQNWLTLYPWLDYSAKQNVMWCKICRKNKMKNSMALDNNNFRTSTLTRHVTNAEHVRSIQIPDEQNNMQKARDKAFSKEEKAVEVALMTVFWLAQESLPLSKYTSFIKFLKKLKVPNSEHLEVSKHTNYESYTTALDLAQALSDVIDGHITQQLKESPCITILTDESTDIVVHHKLCISARIVDPISLSPKTLFLSDIRLDSGTGQGIFHAIENHLQDRDISIKSVIQLGTDGASAMTGRNEGLTGQFLRRNPHVLNNHCAAHRLALCTEQAANKLPAIKQFKETLETVYYHFKKSPDKIGKMEHIQKVLNDPIIKYREIHEVRWLSCFEAIEAVVRTMDSILTYCQTYSAKDPKTKGIQKKVATEFFVLMAHGMLDILAPVMKLNLLLQKKELDIGTVQPAVEHCIKVLMEIRSVDNISRVTYVQTAKKEMSPGGNFKGHKIAQKGGKVPDFAVAYVSYIDAIVKNIETRFPESNMMSAFAVLALRPISFLSETELDTWGDDQLETLLDHFGNDKSHTFKNKETGVQETSVSSAIVDPQESREEWIKLKRTVKIQAYPRDQMNILWKLVATYHGEDYPNLIKLAGLAMTHPVHTADCERVFSCQNQVTTSLRNRLTATHCEQMMRIKLEGGELSGFDYDEAIQKWRSLKHRDIFC